MNYPFIHYRHESYSIEDLEKKSSEFYQLLNKRRSVRDFSNKVFPIQILENIILSAGTAPSGANKQPWHFCIIQDATIKKKIREAAEEEEKENYNGRMSDEWLEDLAPLGTDWQKEFLEIAPYLIVVFKKPYDISSDAKKKNYYVSESVGIACGLLITAIHQAGLVCLTHTPSPMNFLAEILNRPENEKAYLLIPVGYPAEGAMVPDIFRKNLDEIMTVY